MPYGSIFDSAYAIRCGSKALSTRPPSSGGIGNRLNAATTRLTSTPARAICAKNGSSTCASTRPSAISAQAKACTRFAPGPASATHMLCQRGLRSRPKATGTGLA